MVRPVGRESSASSSGRAGEAGSIIHYDVESNIIEGIGKGMAFYKGNNTWLSGASSPVNEEPSELIIKPGRGYLFFDPVNEAGFSWEQPLPY